MKFCETILVILICEFPGQFESSIGDFHGTQLVEKRRGPNDTSEKTTIEKIKNSQRKNRRKSSRDRSFMSHYGQSDKLQKVKKIN